MKKVELLGLSVVAALVMTGCNSDDDAVAATGAEAPAELTAPIDINYTSIKNAMYVATSMANSKLPVPMLAVVADTGSGKENTSDTYDCDISGTYTDTYTYSWSGVDGAQHSDGNGLDWTWTENYTTKYNNCVDTYSSTQWPLYLDMATRTRNGSDSWEMTNSYDVDTNTSKQKMVTSDNYTDAREDNESEASVVYTYDKARTRTRVWEGDVYADAEITGASYSYTDFKNGFEMREDTNTTGSIVYGDKTVKGNYSETKEGVWDETATYAANGFTTSYDINASGEMELDGGKSFKKFAITTTANGADEDNITISGTIGNSCLGGSVDFGTAPVVQSDEVNYFSDLIDPTVDVLPHAGAFSVGTASVAFSVYDTNKTQAVITGVEADANETVLNWTDLAIQNCVN